MTIVMRGGLQCRDHEGIPQQGGNGSTVMMQQPITNDEVENETEGEGQEPVFPQDELMKLDEMINRPRWIVPVLPKGELEVLLNASIELCKRGIDTRSEPCQIFFKEGLTISFAKILTDEAVSGWKYEIHQCILRNCEKLIELCVLKLNQDWFPLLELLAMVLNPNNKFHSFNCEKPSKISSLDVHEEEIYACSYDNRTPKGWLVDLINRFGSLGGFKILLERFMSGKSLSVAVIFCLLKPFGLCVDYLTNLTVRKYFMPVVEKLPVYLESLTDEELKKEAKNESKNDALSLIVKYLKAFASKDSNQEEIVKNLEMFRLKMILRLLQISSFNGKMNALNELNKVIANVSCYSHRHTIIEEEEWLNAKRMAEWIKDNKVLHIVLRDSLHQPQYVEKLEKMIRFVIKEKTLTMEDLDNIWEAQAGKHEAIVKNVHDLLAKLAWDFSPDQLDHLFKCFQMSWTQANRKQREKLIELIQRLAEDDKEGVMAVKVLTLLWNLAHSDELPTEIMTQALNAMVKIFENSCSHDKDSQKMQWLTKCVEELKHEQWVIPALMLIKDICVQYGEAPQQNFNPNPRAPHIVYRHELISKLQDQHLLVILVTNNLTSYMDKIRRLYKDKDSMDPLTIILDGRYNHVTQIFERLDFLRFLLKDGQLWLCAPQAEEIWVCLAVNGVFPVDRDACFKWFSKLMGEEPDLDPDINKSFFENKILKLDPILLTENGMKCFERFFKIVNAKESKLVEKRRNFFMDDHNLIGLEYLWKVVLCGGTSVANKAIELLKETFTSLGPKLQDNQIKLHEHFIDCCFDRMKISYELICSSKSDQSSQQLILNEVTKVCRVLKVLYEYISECDGDYGDERTILPLARAHRGKHLTLTVKFPNPGRTMDDIEITSHTNETLGAVRRQIMKRTKVNNANMKVDLICNGENLKSHYDKKLISQIPSLKDRVLSAKFCPVTSNLPSSPDSSSDSSAGSPQLPFDLSNIPGENNLPGVYMSEKKAENINFLIKLSDLGSELENAVLRDSARSLLKLIPADVSYVEALRTVCSEFYKGNATELEMFFSSLSTSGVLYKLEILYSLLLPATSPLTNKTVEFQYNFIKSGGVDVVLGMLTKLSFLSNADHASRRAGHYLVLKLGKFLLLVVAYCIVQGKAGNQIKNWIVQFHSKDEESLNYNRMLAVSQKHSKVLEQALKYISDPSKESVVCDIACGLSKRLATEMNCGIPDACFIKALIKIAWSACKCNTEAFRSNDHIPQSMIDSVCEVADSEDINVCKEALETLTIAIAIRPTCMEVITNDPQFSNFVVDLLLFCKHIVLRATAAEQFHLIATKCCCNGDSLSYFVNLLFTVLSNNELESKLTYEYFQLLCQLLNFGFTSNYPLDISDDRLADEIQWLKKVRLNVLQTGDIGVDHTLLEGHLGICRELLAFQTSEKKFQIGCDPSSGCSLVKEIVEDFLCPASKMLLQYQKTGEIPSEQPIPVCSSPATINAGYDLLVALCTGCVRNFKKVSNMLSEMYYSDHEDCVTEWEYLPPVGPRQHKGFVGLKNAGATCYMNSVLQQLYMIAPIRKGILSAEGAANDIDEDFSGEDRLDQENTLDSGDADDDRFRRSESRREYNIGILKQIQAIFGHLACSKLQYYVPRGLWKHFRLTGEPLNLREQHDALEFFNSLVDSLDEALKALDYEQVMSKVLGGSFADQKICKDCPHRYSREESFTVLNIDIRNQCNLLDSLEQYVKGDLLEGVNAYHCDKCDKKVDTVKRMCIKKLPPVLAIQLKRFDYDWERESAIKFNDYFEFPRELELEPYTVSGLAKMEGEMIHDDSEFGENMSEYCTKYKLTGIVVHSGQASGGHYYSYILHRHSDGNSKWYKFDDGDVSECKMENDEEMKAQCFGGEYTGEVFDHISKRMNPKKQKRWWNAYILFYTRLDVEEHVMIKSFQELTLTDNHHSLLKMPAPIERSVLKQNVKFLHTLYQFSPEYFNFMQKLLTCNTIYIASQDEACCQEAEELAKVSISLGSKFLFSIGFRTKKNLRGSASDWAEALCIHLKASKSVRSWFAHHVLINHPNIFVEYLLECPSSEVRTAFSKLIVCLAHYALRDDKDPIPGFNNTSLKLDTGIALSDYILTCVLGLLKKEAADHYRHLPQYFNLFYVYMSYGVKEKAQLLRLNALASFINFAIDEGSSPPNKYQYGESGKLYQVVSQLVCCCDLSFEAQSCHKDHPSLPNKYGDPEPIMAIQPCVAEVLIKKTSYLKKVIEFATTSEDTLRLLKFCCWENYGVSTAVLNDILWQIAYSYNYELMPYLDLLVRILLLDDSWQSYRISNALNDERLGLFDTISRSISNYQKRAYFCIKALVTLFTSCPSALKILFSNNEVKKKWQGARDWLQEELDGKQYACGNHYTGYPSWTQSNDATNCYYLERSPSARLLLEKVCELCPEEELEIDNDRISEDGESPLPEDQKDSGCTSHIYHKMSSSQRGILKTHPDDVQIEHSRSDGEQ